MDKTALVAEDITQGRRFVDGLRSAGLPVAVAMWFKKPSSDRWVLGIASPDVQVHGTLPVIRLGEAVRHALGEPSIARDDLYFLNTSGGFLDDIARFPTRITGDFTVVESFSLGVTDIEKAIVLWLDRSATPSRRPPTLAPGEGIQRKAS